MAHRVDHDENDQWTIVFEDEPPHVHGLAFAPKQREAELNTGRWLVLVVAIWSGPDRDAIGKALKAIKQCRTPIKLRVRMFDDYEEVLAWLPEASQSWGSPQWFLLEDGRLLAERFGQMATEEIIRFVG